MSGSSRARSARASATALTSRSRAAEIYDRYGARLYRQAHLALGDQGQAEQAVCDVMVSECLRPGTPDRGPEAGRRLAVAAYWRCRDLISPQDWHLRPPQAGPANLADPRRLSGRERAALALVLFGGLSRRQASQELAIPAAEMSALLLTVMRHLAAMPASPA